MFGGVDRPQHLKDESMSITRVLATMTPAVVSAKLGGGF